MANVVGQTVQIQGWLDRLRAGDESARAELLNCACERLTRLTRKMLKGYPRVKRWEQTDDVLQNATVRLYRALSEVKPLRAVDFFRLAALNIRRELLDLAKHYYGPQGLGARHASVAADPQAERRPDEAGAPADPGTTPPAWRAGPSSTPRSLSCRRRTAKSSTCCGTRSCPRRTPPPS
jgi:hypothetical protein